MSTTTPGGDQDGPERSGSTEPSAEPVSVSDPMSPDGQLLTFFDPAHYRSQLRRAQLRRLGRRDGDELDHYVGIGWKAGLDPSPDFSTEGYLEANPDVRAAGVDPLTHWVYFGRAEGRKVVSPAEFADPPRLPPLDGVLADHCDELVAHLSDLGLEVDASDLHAALVGLEPDQPGWFDGVWYLSMNPDVVSAGIDPFVHYTRFGFREHRWPNPEVAARGGTIGSPIDRVLSTRDVRIDTAVRLSTKVSVSVSPSVVIERIQAALADGGRHRLVVAIGHDDFTANVGGVQLCEGLEQREFARRGIVHVFVHPSVPLQTLHPSDGESCVRVVLDGVPLDHDVRLADLTSAWADSELAAAAVDAIVVHSIVGHSPERIGAFIDTVSPRRHLWWIHDFVSQCPNWLLLRNGVDPCGAPPLSSLSCRLCAWGPERVDHLLRLHHLWSEAPWEFLAPSAAALAPVMSGSAPLPDTPVVIPHLELRRAAVDRPPFPSEPPTVRLGFLGEPKAVKGWEVFVALVDSAPEGIEFVHLGAYPGVESGIEFVPLRQTADSVGAMVDAVRSHRLDAILVWPSKVETFSFVAAEAIAGGCEILTHPKSGNVLAMGERHGRVVVFESVEELFAADLLSILSARRRSATPSWEIVIGSGLTPAVLDGRLGGVVS